MFLLRWENSAARCRKTPISKFHYVSIKIDVEIEEEVTLNASKFHYVSIKMVSDIENSDLFTALNSTMFLLRYNRRKPIYTKTEL